METELKLLLATADVPAMRRHPLLTKLAVSREPAQQLVSTYFDTPGLYLRQRGYVLRVRQKAQQQIQTLKHDGQASAGLYQRDEWESAVSGTTPDLPLLCALPGVRKKLTRMLSVAGLADNLTPIFSTRIRRTIWHLETAQGDQIEFALDQGKVECGEHQQAISEIELELKSGQPKALFELALLLQNTIPLSISTASKSDRGFDLLAPQTPAPVKVTPIEFPASCTPQNAMQMIISNCLTQIQGNEAGVMHGSDPEYIHQMRVGLRRLRLAFELFHDVAPCDEDVLETVEWLAAKLGMARNWDVLAFDILPGIAQALPAETGLPALQAAAIEVADRQRHSAAITLGSPRYSQLLLRLGGWLQNLNTPESAPEDEAKVSSVPLEKFASGIVVRYRKKLKQRGKNLMPGDTSAHHHLRIAAKKLRYASEFFQSLKPASMTNATVEALNQLLHALGRINDVACADELLRHLAEVTPEAAHSAGFVRGYLIAGTGKESRQARRLWQQLVGLS